MLTYSLMALIANLKGGREEGGGGWEKGYFETAA